MPGEPVCASAVRLAIYRYFVTSGHAPSAADLAAQLEREAAEMEQALDELAAARVITLAPGTRSVWMAHPFSALPTPYRVRAGPLSYWANCAWDALGIAVVLGHDTVAVARCPDCGVAVDLSVRSGFVDDRAGVVHFAVPPRRFWENIAFT